MKNSYNFKNIATAVDSNVDDDDFEITGFEESAKPQAQKAPNMMHPQQMCQPMPQAMNDSMGMPQNMLQPMMPGMPGMMQGDPNMMQNPGYMPGPQPGFMPGYNMGYPGYMQQPMPGQFNPQNMPNNP